MDTGVILDAVPCSRQCVPTRSWNSVDSIVDHFRRSSVRGGDVGRTFTILIRSFAGHSSNREVQIMSPPLTTTAAQNGAKGPARSGTWGAATPPVCMRHSLTGRNFRASDGPEVSPRQRVEG